MLKMLHSTEPPIRARRSALIVLVKPMHARCMFVSWDSSAMQCKCAELGTCSAKVPLVLVQKKKCPW